MRILSAMVILAGCTSWLIPSRADTATTASPLHGSPLHPNYLTGKEKLWADFPKAPQLGSPVDEADLAITLSIQASRNEEQKTEANRDQKFSIMLVAGEIDPSFETKYPRTFEVLKQAGQDGAFITSILKNENGRLRPYVQHPTLVLPLFPSAEFSYPSGHSSSSELQARLLGKLFPGKAEALLHRARQIADSRVVAGVHYASDTEAGLALGDLLFSELEANAKFQSAFLDAARQDKIPLP